MHFTAKTDLMASNWSRGDGPQDPETKLFARTYDEDREEIVRIFSHLLKKYPAEDAAELFNYMFVSLYDLKVYQRWNVAKVVAAEVRRRTKSKAKANAAFKRLTAAGNDEAERVAIDMGINLKAKRGRFLYKWIEHAMGEHYHKVGKRWQRFVRHDESLHGTPSWSMSRRNHGYVPWDSGEGAGGSSGGWGHAVNHRRRIFPVYDGHCSCMSQYSAAQCSSDPHESLDARELIETVMRGLDDVDRAIVAMKIDGYTSREISDRLRGTPGMPDLSHSMVQIRLSRIRQQKRPKPTTKKPSKNPA